MLTRQEIINAISTRASNRAAMPAAHDRWMAVVTLLHEEGFSMTAWAVVQRQPMLSSIISRTYVRENETINIRSCNNYVAGSGWECEAY